MGLRGLLETITGLDVSLALHDGHLTTFHGVLTFPPRKRPVTYREPGVNIA